MLIERVKIPSSLVPARAVMFDFDGTVGLVRAGWMPLMLDMMMRTLAPLGPDPVALRAEAEDYVARLTGKDTVHQMNAFADHVRALGGNPRTGAEYKAEFMQVLGRMRAERLAAPEGDRHLVPGTRVFLENLRARGLKLYLASGSDHEEILEDTAALGIAAYFDGIYGSAPGVPNKPELLARIQSEGTPASAILTFGDGRVEIEAARDAGGRSVGVATLEPECLEVDPDKRRWLMDAGADYIIPNYLSPDLHDVVEGRL